MKTRLIQTAAHHVVAIDSDTELRAYFISASLHTACTVQDTLCRDAARFGVDVGTQGEFETLPIITVRVANSGRKVYEISKQQLNQGKVMGNYYIGSSGDDLWHESTAKTLTAAKSAASRMYQQSVGGKIMVGEKFAAGTEAERIERVAVKHGYDNWQSAQ